MFISLASYRDPELIPTIKNALETAKNPENLRFGVVLQDGDEERKNFPFNNEPFYKFGLVSVNVNESEGACWARSQSQTLYRGEKYVLTGDSHLRFVPGWDEILKGWFLQLAKKFPKPIISTYPIPYNPGDSPSKYLKTVTPTKMTLDKFNGQGIVVFGNQWVDDYKNYDEPIPTYFLAGGFSFTWGKWVQEVPYDPNLYFIGEEISMAVRSWTSGYDIFYPHRAILYHAYSKGRDRVKHWDEHKLWYKKREQAVKRVKQLLGTEPTDGVDFGIYGLGNIRSIHEYEEATGINFAKKEIQRKRIWKKHAKYYIVETDYTPEKKQGPNQRFLEVKKNDILEIKKKTELGWCLGVTIEDEHGWVPCSNLKKIDVTHKFK